MNPFLRDEKARRFWEGEFSLKEEQDWIDDQLETGPDSPEKLYARYILSERKCSENLDPEFENLILKEVMHKPFRHLMRWAAAAVLLIMLGASGILVSHHHQEIRKREYAQLESALQFASEKIAPRVNHEVIYQDELLVILAVD